MAACRASTRLTRETSLAPLSALACEKRGWSGLVRLVPAAVTAPPAETARAAMPTSTGVDGSDRKSEPREPE